MVATSARGATASLAQRAGATVQAKLCCRLLMRASPNLCAIASQSLHTLGSTAGRPNAKDRNVTNINFLPADCAKFGSKNVPSLCSRKASRPVLVAVGRRTAAPVVRPNPALPKTPGANTAAVRPFHSTRAVEKRDFYDVLGVQRGADKSEEAAQNVNQVLFEPLSAQQSGSKVIKRKYFQLAKKYHPDQNKNSPDAKQKFQEVTEAYECLSNDDKRTRYDQFGHAGVDPNGAGAGPGGGDPFAGFGGFGAGGPFQGGFQGRVEIDPDELFEQLFGSQMGGRQRRPRGPRPGRDLQLGMKLSFLEAAFGTTKDLNVSYTVVEGNARKRKTRSVKVEVPGGVENGIAIHLRGEGADGEPGARRGDLYVQLEVEPDPYFERSGADVHVATDLTLSQAALGCKVDIMTIDGMVEVTIPKGSQPEGVLMLRGRGLPRLTGTGARAGRGDQLVHLKVKVPTKLSKRQKELLEELRDEEDRLAGKKVASRSRDSDAGSKSSSSSSSSSSSRDGRAEAGDATGSSGGGSDERSGISGFMQDAFDRVKTHLAGKQGKEKASSGSSSS